jgi:tetratricopeptide (TPR) repeat protein
VRPDAHAEAAERFEQQGNVFGLGWARGWLGLLARADGDLARAEAIQLDVLALGEREGVPHIVAAACAELSKLAHEHGDADRAVDLLDRAIELFGDVDDRWQVAVHVGMRAVLQADVAAAAANARDSLRMFEELRSDPDTRVVLLGAAKVLHDAGRRRDAAVLVGAGSAGGVVLTSWAERLEVRDVAVAVLDDPELEPAVAEGRRVGRWQAAQLAQRWLDQLAAASTST